MNDPRGQLNPGEADPARTANEQFIHGLLEFHQKDGPPKQEQRLQKLMRSIDAEIDPQESPHLQAQSRNPSWLRIASIAIPALILISVFVLSRNPSAVAIINSAIEALPEVGDRRYQVLAQIDADNRQAALVGNLDIRDREHLLLQVTTADGYRLVMGRNADGDWLLQDAGEANQNHIEHLGKQTGWPSWLDLGSHAILLDSVDNLLTHLRQDYDLVHGEQPAAENAGSVPVPMQITALRRSRDPAAAQRIDLWIDQHSHLVERMELHWPAHRHQEQSGQHPGQHQGLHGQHSTPHLRHVRPDFGSKGLHTPHSLSFKLVEHSPFAPDWFEAESHNK